jgi:ribosomal protein S2
MNERKFNLEALDETVKRSNKVYRHTRFTGSVLTNLKYFRGVMSAW